MGRWAVAIVKGGSEGPISEELCSLEIQSYFPMYKKWRKLPKHLAKKRGKLREIVSFPLLHGYMFTKVDSANSVRAILGTKDVYGFIRTANSICFARDNDIAEFRQAVESGKYDDTRTIEEARIDMLREKFNMINLFDLKGESVRITDGFFSGRNARVEEVSKNLREAKLEFNGAKIVVGLEQLQLSVGA